MDHLIFLAAGFSKRFGSNKLLYEWNGKPMYRWVLDHLVSIQSDFQGKFRVLIVTQYDEIIEYSRLCGCDRVVNPDPSRGISSSIQTGILHLKEKGLLHKGDRIVFFNADQPELMRETILNFLITSADSGLPLAAVSTDGEMISPCIFEECFVPVLMAIRGDRGGKSILNRNRDKVFLFDIDSAEQLADIDAL